MKKSIVAASGVCVVGILLYWFLQGPEEPSLQSGSAGSGNAAASQSFVSVTPAVAKPAAVKKQNSVRRTPKPPAPVAQPREDEPSVPSDEDFDPGHHSPGVEQLACDGFDDDCGECWRHEDCPSGSVCLVSPETKLNKCFTDSCTHDDACEPGSVCRVFGLDGFDIDDDGNLEVHGGIRLCVPGILKEGELCPSTSPKAGCASGLACVRGFCQQRCESDSDCPEGANCQPVPEGGKACAFGCPECGDNEACIEGVTGGRCVQLLGDNCFAKPCAEGSTCSVSFSAGNYAIVGECVTPCGDSSPTNLKCPEGKVCGSRSPSRCLDICDPSADSSCPENKHCAVIEHDPVIWGCVPWSGF